MLSTVAHLPDILYTQYDAHMKFYATLLVVMMLLPSVSFASVIHTYDFVANGNDSTGVFDLTAQGGAHMFDSCAAEFDAGSDFYSNDAPGFGAHFTEASLNTWVKLTALPASDEVAGIMYWNDQSNSTALQIFLANESGTQKVKFRMFDSGHNGHDAVDTETLSLDTWYMVTITYDGDWIRGYVNGTQVAATAFSGGMGSNDGGDKSRVGTRGGTDNMLGLQNRTTVYSNALSSGDVTTLFAVPNTCSDGGGGEDGGETPTATATSSVMTCITAGSTTTCTIPILHTQDAGNLTYEIGWILFCCTFVFVGALWNSTRIGNYHA